MTDTSDLTIEAAVDAIVAAVPVIDVEDRFTDPKVLISFIQDMAQGIYSKAAIAQRYGVTTDQMLEFLQTHPQVVRQIKLRKASHESDGNVAEAIRLEAGMGVRELIPGMVVVAADEKNPLAARLDAAKQLARMAGVDGVAPGAAQSNGAKVGNQFVVNFNFRGQPKETIATTVVENVTTIELPAPDDGALDEEV